MVTVLLLLLLLLMSLVTLLIDQIIIIVIIPCYKFSKNSFVMHAHTHIQINSERERLCVRACVRTHNTNNRYLFDRSVPNHVTCYLRLYQYCVKLSFYC